MTKDFKKQSATGGAFGQYGLGWMVGGVAIGLLIGAGMYTLANKGNVAPASATLAATSPTVNAGSATAAPSTTAPLVGNNGAASLQDSPTNTNAVADETPGFSYHAVLPQLEIDVPLSAQVEQQMAATHPPVAKPAADTKKEPEKTEPEKKTTAAEKVPEKTSEKSPDKTSAVPEKKAPPAAASTVPTGFNGFQIGSYKTPEQAADMQQRLRKNGLNSRIEAANVQGATWYRVKIGPASSPAMLQKWQQTLSGMGISPMAVRM